MRERPTVTIQRRWLALIFICSVISFAAHVVTGFTC